jgi:hypothetical protein
MTSHLRDAHVEWPPQCFESLLTPDLFLASKLSIDYIVAEFAALADPKSHVEKPAPSAGTVVTVRTTSRGWTRKQLIDATGKTTSERISPATFDRLRRAAGVPAARRGQKGRPFPPSDVKMMMGKAEERVPQCAVLVTRAWTHLLNNGG